MMARFAPFEGPLFESTGEYNLTVLLDGEISTPVSVTILGVLGKINVQLLIAALYNIEVLPIYCLWCSKLQIISKLRMCIE